MSLSSSQRASLETAVSEYEQYLHLAGSYVAGRGIPESVGRTHRLGVVAEPLIGHESYAGRLVIPYLTRSGVVNIKFRCMEEHSCKDVGCPKYLGLIASNTRIYNVEAFFTQHPYIAIAEGEFDAMVLHALGDIPAVAIPGVQNWKSFYDKCFFDFEKIYLFEDGDEAGKDFGKKVADRLDGVIRIAMPAGLDVNEVFLKEGREGLRKRAGLT